MSGEATQSSARVTGHVLVIDDEPANRLLLTDLLTSRGHEVSEADTGQLGLELAQQSRPDAILLDVMMPGLDGLEICRRLKATPETAVIPVLLVTSLDNRDDRIKGMRAGANDFISKPFDATDLLLRVRNAVFTRRLFQRLERQYQQLEELESLRDDLVHLIIHDFRSPLAGVYTYLELLQMLATDRGDSQESSAIAHALETLVRLREMTDLVLDVSRLEAGKMPVHRAPVELPILVTEALQLLGPDAIGRRVRVEGVPPALECDAGLVRRILTNLIGNALKFSAPDTEVRVVLADDGSDAVVRVVDAGPGIAPEDRDRIFERFGQARGGARSRGSGLGLAFCKMAVEAHGGRIGFESEVGRGSTFWFTLPAQERGSRSAA